MYNIGDLSGLGEWSVELDPDKRYISCLQSPLTNEATFKDDTLEYRNEYNELHRDPELGPALQYHSKAGDYCISYIVIGITHRNPEDGPAIQMFLGENKGDDIYMVEGRMHRNPHDGGAIIRHYPGKKEVEHFYYVDDLAFDSHAEAVDYWDKNH